MGGSGNSFNLPYPDGGNYWSDWTAPDIDLDGFVDSPYVFAGGQDNLPWSVQDGWWCGVEPPLTLAKTASYWASYQDYTDRLLSIDYLVDNDTGPTAYGVYITGAVNTNGVTLVTPVPITLGNIEPCCDSTALTLKYDVPTGVQNFMITAQATSWDVCGGGYSYP